MLLPLISEEIFSFIILSFDNINVRKLELIDDVFDVNDPNDQTMFIICESAIEMILQKV